MGVGQKDKRGVVRKREESTPAPPPVGVRAGHGYLPGSSHSGPGKEVQPRKWRLEGPVGAHVGWG